MRMMAKLMLAGGLVLASTSLALANPYTSETVTYGPATTNWSTTLNFSSFNSSLGTLTSATISITETLAGDAYLQNMPGGVLSSSASITQTNTLTLTPSVTGFSQITVNDSASTCSPGTYCVSLNVGQTKSAPTDFPAFSASQTYSVSTTSNLSQFETSWTASTSDNTTSNTVFTGGATTGGMNSQSGELSATVYYYYAAASVPEPFSAAMLGVGVLSLGFARCRFRQ